MLAILIYFLIGFATGLRSLTPIAVVSWAAHLGWLDFRSSILALVGTWPAVVMFTLLAATELVADKLPRTPARTKAVGLAARVTLGCVCAVLLCVASSGNIVFAAIVGIVGAIVGAFAGYHTRRFLLLRAGMPDFIVALTEDLITIAGSLLIVSHSS